MVSEPSYAVFTEGLSRTFGGVKAVDNLNLAISPGEIYGFLGPNGAGKTTLIRMLVTLLKPTGGRAVVAGHDLLSQAAEVRLRIGAALQDAGLDNKQTGLELLRLQGRLYGLSSKETRHRIADLLSMVDIGDAIDRQIGTYSGGMKRRLDLAASLIHNPKILFMDEPTTGLDPLSRVRVWEEIEAINREIGVTIFLTTHYLEEADALAGRVGIISHGELAIEGTPSDLKRSIASDFIIARVGGSAEKAVTIAKNTTGINKVRVDGDRVEFSVANGASMVSTVALLLNNAGVMVKELTLRTPTLDDVFFHITGARLDQDNEKGE